LARSGVDVLVLEAGIVGFGASGRNGGGCTHGYSPLFHEEQRLWPMMDELLGYPTEFRPGRIRVAFDDDELELMRPMNEVAVAQGFRSEELDGDQIRQAAPLVGDNAIGGFFEHYGGHANPHRTVQGYAWAIQDHGGRVIQHTTVTGFDIAGGRVQSVHSSRGTLGCDQVVLAAGPRTGTLASALGVSVPLATARVEMIVTEPLALMPHGRVDGNGIYGRQTLRGNLAYGGGPHEWFDVGDPGGQRPGSSPLSRSIARRVAELLPKAVHARVIRSWGGVVEVTPDGRPIIDYLEDPDNVVVATMSSLGFGLSPATGHAIQELVTTDRCSFTDLSTLGLSRFTEIDPQWQSRQGWTRTAREHD
jgi:sarcosine oxidase subunit beta